VDDKKQALREPLPSSQSDVTRFNKNSLHALALAHSDFSPASVPLSLDHFLALSKIGKGGFGIVFHVVDRFSGKDYALKVVDKSNVRSQHTCLILREQAAHRAVSATGSRSFLQLHASWHDSANFYMLTVHLTSPTGEDCSDDVIAQELQPRGDLRTDMRRVGIYDRAQAAYIAAELLVCLGDLHSRRMMHRDLKPDNVLLDTHGHLMLADFGMAKTFVVSDGEYSERERDEKWDAINDNSTNLMDFTRLPCGTPRYMAPEVLESKWYTYSADVWSVGVILHMLLTGRVS
jgi:serine/threonine protein kinase